MPKKKQTPEQLSLTEIQTQLAQLEADEAALRAALRERQAVEFAEFVDDLREQIVAHGYELGEVARRLGQRRRGRAVKPGSARGTRYIDPDNPDQSYSRGPIPAWLREKMEAAGYDPADKVQRDDFKSTHLRLAA